MRAGESDALPLPHCLSNFLLSYRSTPHAMTNRAQSELFLRPNHERIVDGRQAQQKTDHDRQV